MQCNAPRDGPDEGRAAQSGFTLVEIMVVIVILGILATIVGTNVLGQSDEARIKAAEIEVKSIGDNVALWMVKNPNRIPEWEDLITPDARGNRQINEEEPKQDPWGNEYEISRDPDYENQYLIVSWGPDGQQDTEDDITTKTIRKRKTK